jgi:hypothetical protein
MYSDLSNGQRSSGQMEKQEYRLGSAPMINAPGVVRWAINGYHFKRDRAAMVGVIVAGWSIPNAAAVALLSGDSPFAVEGETVVFIA